MDALLFGVRGADVSKTKIEWTEQSWNPILGCSIKSPGCMNCYAMPMAARCESMGLSRYDGLTKVVNGNVVWTGKLVQAPEATLLAPLKRKKPTTYFVNSMGDLFHEDCPDEWIDRVFAMMALCPQHTFQVLTKRAERMRDYVTDPDDGRGHINTYHRILDAADRMIGNYSLTDSVVPEWPLPNVWLGVSTERQQEADERIPFLLETPAAVRFISAEPLLGDIQLHPLGDGTNALTSGTGPNLDWVIIGGESGPHARPMHPNWARSLRDHCAAAGVRMFFKQWGQMIPESQAARDHQGAHTCQTFGAASIRSFNEVFWYVGKQRAGRLLDGREHNAMPERAT
jgi:protein gp37